LLTRANNLKVAIIILAAFITRIAYAIFKTLAYNKGKLSSLSNFTLIKTPFKARTPQLVKGL